MRKKRLLLYIICNLLSPFSGTVWLIMLISFVLERMGCISDVIGFLVVTIGFALHIGMKFSKNTVHGLEDRIARKPMKKLEPSIASSNYGNQMKIYRLHRKPCYMAGRLMGSAYLRFDRRLS